MKLRNSLLLTAQRALLIMIYPSIRAITVGIENNDKLKVIYYLDRTPIHKDCENISDVAGEICSDLYFLNVEEICLFNNIPISD